MQSVRNKIDLGYNAIEGRKPFEAVTNRPLLLASCFDTVYVYDKCGQITASRCAHTLLTLFYLHSVSNTDSITSSTYQRVVCIYISKYGVRREREQRIQHTCHRFLPAEQTRSTILLHYFSLPQFL